MKTNKNRRQEHIDFHRNYCVHYAPRDSGNDTSCRHGLKPERVAVGLKGTKWAPCIEGHLLDDPCAVCPKWERPSLESGEKYADDIEAIMQRMTIVDPVINAWRRKLPIGKAEVIECPVCQGRLHLSQAACNGHVRARCETADCVSFIE